MWFNRLCIWSSLKTTRLHWRHLAVYTSFNAGCSRCGWRNLWVRWGAWCPDGWGPKFQTWQGEVLKAGESICLFERIGQSWKINENHIRIYIYIISINADLFLYYFLLPFRSFQRTPNVWDPSRIYPIHSYTFHVWGYLIWSGGVEWGLWMGHYSNLWKKGAFQLPDSIFPDCENWALLDKPHLSLLVYSPVIQHSYGKWMNMAYFKMITIDYL